jgi:hypothetical protein
LITSILIFFFLFAGTDYFTTICQYQIAEHIMHYSLERSRVEGYLSTADITNLMASYNAAQMNVVDATGAPSAAGVSCTNKLNPGTQLTSPLLRNTDNPDASEIDLLITIKPYNRPFTAGLLVGGSAAPSTYRIKVGGSVLSEYVSP